MRDLDLAAIRSRIAATPPKLATIREMTPAEIAQVLTDRAALVAEVERLRDLVSEAWDDGNCVGLDGWVGPGRGAGEVDPEAMRARRRITGRAALDALDALDVGGE